MINSAHDSIHGSSTDEVHTEMEARFAKTRQIAAGVIHDTMAHLGKYAVRWWEKMSDIPEIQQPVVATFAKNDGYMHHIRPKGILVYAPVVTETAQPSELWLPIGDSQVCICDSEGKAFLTQVMEREKVEVNGLGKPRNSLFPDPIYRKVVFLHPYDTNVKTLAAIPGKYSPKGSIKAGDDFLENELVRVTVSGSRICLLDKRSGKEFHNLNLLEEEADAGDAWDFSPTWIPGEIVRSTSFPFTSRILECGAVRAVLEVNGRMSVPACLRGDERSEERVTIPITYQITLWQGMERVDVKLKLDNTAKDHRIRLRIPANLKTDHVSSQGHLAILNRPVVRPKPAEPWFQPPTQLLPCREWIAVEDDNSGLAVALKGMYDYEAVMNPLNQEPDVYITLVRGFELMGRLHMLQREGPASEAIDTPQAQCMGVQEIEWSYIPYQVSSEDRAPFLPMVQCFLYPAVSHAVRTEPLSEKFVSFPQPFGWKEPNLQFSAFKKCLNRDGYLLRFFENQGKETKANIYVGRFKKAWKSNMDEATLESLEILNGFVEVNVPPYKAVSIKLSGGEE